MICRLLEGDNRKMKQYGKGSNKSRFLVLSLIIILIIVPFLSHTGYEGETKAKSGKTQAIVCKNISSLPGVIVEKTKDGENKIYIQSITGESYENVGYDKDKLDLKLIVNDITVESNDAPKVVDFTGSDMTEYKCHISDYEFGYVMAENQPGKMPADIMADDAVKSLDKLGNEEIKTDDIIAVYAKPIINKVTTAADVNSEIDRTLIPDTGYGLVAAYVLVNQTYDIENKISFKCFNGVDYVEDVENDTLYGNVCAYSDAALPMGNVGEIKYACVLKSDFETKEAADCISELHWGIAVPYVIKQGSVAEDGEYVVVTGYFVDGTGNGLCDTLADYKVSKAVNMDVTGPDIDMEIRLANDPSAELAGYSDVLKKYYISTTDMAGATAFIYGDADISVAKKTDENNSSACDCETVSSDLHKFSIGSYGQGTYIITAKDEFLNSVVRQVEVALDNKIPVIDSSSIKVGTVHIGGASDEPEISGSNILYFNASDDSGLALTCNVEVMPDSVGAPIQSAVAEYDSNLGCYYLEMALDGPGVYDLTIQAKDVAGNKSVPVGVRFRYDKSKPVIKEPIFQYSQSGSDLWQDIPESCMVDNTFVVNPADSCDYSFLVEIEEDNIQSVKLGSRQLEKVEELCLGNITYWRYRISDEELALCDDKNPLVFENIVAVDLAGNTEDAVVSTKILKANMMIQIDDAVLEDEDGNTIPLSEIKDIKYTNRTFVVRAWVSSGYEIAKASLVYNENGVEKEYKNIISGIDNYTDDISRRRSAIVSFEIFKGTDINKILNNMYIKVGDTAGQEMSSSVFTLFLDKTFPQLITNPTEAPVTWQKKGYSFGATIKPGEMSDPTVPESGIVDGATYSIIGSDDEDMVNSLETKADENGISFIDEIIRVPVSKDVTGTIVSFFAKDKAGNLLKENQFVVKVDGDNPVVEGVSVVNSDDRRIGPLNKDIFVYATVSDLLTLDKVDYKVIRQSDESVVAFEKGIRINADKEINDKNVSREIELCRLSGLENDRYRVEVTVYDKAGNVGVLEIPYVFVTDNSRPVVKDNGEGNKGNDFVIENKWYQSYSFDYIISPGVDYLEEEIISKASYTVTREEGNDKIVPIHNVVTDGADRGCAVGIINVPESLTTDGTKIKFYAEDSAGNIIDEPDTFVVKVDKSKPIVEELKIDDYTTNDIFVGTPSLHTTVSDNLSLDKIILKVSYPDKSTVKTYEKTFDLDGEEKNISKTLDYTIEPVGESVPDGEYVATVYAVDKAGNNADAFSYTFFIDNTKPRIRYEDGTEVVSDGIWHMDIGFIKSYILDSGADNNQTKLVFAGYDITGSVNDRNISLISGASLNKILTNIDVPESATPSGTEIKFYASDEAGNQSECNVVYKLDKHNPVISKFTVNDKTAQPLPISYIPVIDVEASDNLSLKTAYIEVVMPDMTKTAPYNMLSDGPLEGAGVTLQKNFHITELIGMPTVPDGKYTVHVYFEDMSGRSVERSVEFEVDNTLPVTKVAVNDGVTANKAPQKEGHDYYYRSNVDVGFACLEKNFNPNKITAADNGSALDVNWQNIAGLNLTNAIISSEGHHEIALYGKDNADNPGNISKINFIIDKTKPIVSLFVNGNTNYSENMGALEFLSDVTVSANVTDANEDEDDLNLIVSKKVPDRDSQITEINHTSGRSFNYSEEADYSIDFYAVDMAGNISDTRNTSFRIDKTAPNLTISGINGSGVSANAVSVSFNMQEAFWWDATGEITIYRKAGDGMEETLLKTIDYKPTAYQSTYVETLTESGTYRMEFTARDKVGHTASTNHTFTIDRNSPEITLIGVNNYDVTDLTVELIVEINDEFYSSKTVSISGTRRDMLGNVNNIDFDYYNTAASPTVISKAFEKDGIYDIEVSSSDIAGNVSSRKVHFTIDKADPVIGGLDKYDGAYIRSFDFASDIENLVLDLTVCDVHMYLNGSEYDGVSDLEDGSYILLVTAEDELGHYVEKSVGFTLDTKAPVFIITGVENREIKDEPYSVNISLQLDEDSLDSVTLNGEEKLIKNNVCSFDVTRKGEYALSMKATDPAGNESTQVIHFRYGEKINNNVRGSMIIISVLVLLIILIAILILINIKSKRRK